MITFEIDKVATYTILLMDMSYIIGKIVQLNLEMILEKNMNTLAKLSP